MEKMLTVKDIQANLNISYNKAYKLIKLKGCPKIKLGGTYMIPEQEFEKWIHAHLYSEIEL